MVIKNFLKILVAIFLCFCHFLMQKCGNKILKARTDGLVNEVDIDSKHFLVFQMITLSNSVLALLLL